MSDGDDIDMLAAEYALGTLDLAERRSVAARRLREPALDRAISDWERRLSPLNVSIAEVEPPGEVWREIETVLEMEAPVALLRRRVSRWKTAALVSSAIAASLVAAIGLREFTREPTPPNFVAVLQKDAASPAFIVSVDLKARMLTVRQVSAEQPAGKSYELWLVNPHEAAPRSLGLIQTAQFTRSEKLESIPADVVENATLAVSLEPEGGSPTGKPTGPVLFAGKLVQATP
jgi:anti-sigma-K factor RskA